MRRPAQTMRAVLFAIATAATLPGFRAVLVSSVSNRLRLPSQTAIRSLGVLAPRAHKSKTSQTDEHQGKTCRKGHRRNGRIAFRRNTAAGTTTGERRHVAVYDKPNIA